MPNLAFAVGEALRRRGSPENGIVALYAAGRFTYAAKHLAYMALTHPDEAVKLFSRLPDGLHWVLDATLPIGSLPPPSPAAGLSYSSSRLKIDPSIDLCGNADRVRKYFDRSFASQRPVGFNAARAWIFMMAATQYASALGDALVPSADGDQLLRVPFFSMHDFQHAGEMLWYLMRDWARYVRPEAFQMHVRHNPYIIDSNHANSEISAAIRECRMKV